MPAPTLPLAFVKFGVQSSPRTRIKRTTQLRPVHRGTTIAACDDDSHRNAAAVAARELYDSLG
ncbi:hypothetical protein [Streptomyces sp. NPDC004728]|uniref:hypothetical protein n=1 Tax=Streptomyces sp. NPDC004728 TaxID=3154289 RepID=UPI0033B951C9